MEKQTNKVIDLFDKNKIIQNGDAKYSKLLQDIISPFEESFSEDYETDDIIEFAMGVWNFANLSIVIPSGEFEKAISPADNFSENERVIFQKMLELKITKFYEHDRYIIDYELKKVGEETRLVVLSGDMEAYMDSIPEGFSNELVQENFEENYIDRYAITIKPLAPFFDWINNLYLKNDDYTTEDEEVNVYLVDDNIRDLEKWLKKKYDRFFTMELEEWHTNKKEWPQKRSYKMFRQWFQVNVSTMVYDLEKRPVLKEE